MTMSKVVHHLQSGRMAMVAYYSTKTIDAYNQCRSRAQDFLIEAVSGFNLTSIQSHLQRPQWTPISDDPSPGECYPLCELAGEAVSES